MKIINEKNYGFDVEPKSILNELSSLKEENKLLKMQLKKKTLDFPDLKAGTPENSKKTLMKPRKTAGLSIVKSV